MPFPAPSPLPDPFHLANRELIRPPGYARKHLGLEPFSNAWFEELEQKRYARHGAWLPTALEFGRHPGESILLIGAGLGSDALQYARHGSEVVIGLTAADPAELIRENLNRNGRGARVIALADRRVPVADASFDVVVWNALCESAPDMSFLPDQAQDLYRVLKPGGKVIGLFPARYDAGFWQDVLLPLQYLYWRRPADPTSGPKTSRSELRRVFSRFSERRVMKRHLRRSELPHLWRVLPLMVMERWLGRVLVLKALKPLSARAGFVRDCTTSSWAA